MPANAVHGKLLRPTTVGHCAVSTGDRAELTWALVAHVECFCAGSLGAHTGDLLVATRYRAVLRVPIAIDVAASSNEQSLAAQTGLFGIVCRVPAAVMVGTENLKVFWGVVARVLILVVQVEPAVLTAFCAPGREREHFPAKLWPTYRDGNVTHSPVTLLVHIRNLLHGWLLRASTILPQASHECNWHGGCNAR